MNQLNLFGKLEEIKATVYFENFNKISDNFEIEDILEFCLMFEKETIVVKGNTNATQILLQFDKSLADIDMQQDGYIKCVSVAQRLNLRHLIGANLKTLNHLKISGERLGVVFHFSNQKKLIFINWGDEIRVMTDIPTHYSNEEIQEIPFDWHI